MLYGNSEIGAHVRTERSQLSDLFKAFVKMNSSHKSELIKSFIPEFDFFSEGLNPDPVNKNIVL